MTKYTTVEGHEIVVGECYQTRNGEKAFISYILDHGYKEEILGSVASWDSQIKWNKDGVAEHPPIRRCLLLDLMRPWDEGKQKPDNCDKNAGNVRENVAPPGQGGDNEGWILYDGWQQPVANSVRINIKFRNNSTNPVNTGKAGNAHWNWHNAGYDIIAYRVVFCPDCEGGTLSAPPHCSSCKRPVKLTGSIKPKTERPSLKGWILAHRPRNLERAYDISTFCDDIDEYLKLYMQEKE